MRKLSPETLEVGKPIPFDCFDIHGTLLLVRGHILENQRQLEELLERGLYEKIDKGEARHSAPAASVPHLINPFDLLDRCKSRLTALLNQVRIDNANDIPDIPDVEKLKTEYRASVAMRCTDPDAYKVMPDGLPTRVMEIATVVQKACHLDADAALGYVHLGLDGRYSIMHPLHCAILTEVLGMALGLEPEQRLSIDAAALTANISILNLQERLHKQEAELSPGQRGLLRLHPLLSCEMLMEAGVKDETWLQAVSMHHERFDGSGYPFDVKGNEIPVTARIVALADIYDAMIKPRGYRTPALSKNALREIFLKRGSTVDEDIAKTLIKEFGLYPPGSFVRLHNGEIAIVFRRGKTATTPLVRSVIGPRGAILEHPLRRNTSETHYVVTDIAPNDRSVRIDLSQLWDYDKN